MSEGDSQTKGRYASTDPAGERPWVGRKVGRSDLLPPERQFNVSVLRTPSGEIRCMLQER